MTPVSGGWRRLGALVGFTVVLAGAAFLVGRRVESQEQAAARAEPPPAPVLTAPIEQRELRQEVVARGRVVPELEMAITLKAPDGRDPVVSLAPPVVGSEVTAGQLVAEISGRPVIALRGDVPAYRDLREGDTGPDVLQLEVGLTEAGYLLGPPDASFDSRTAAAVRRLWQAAGYEPVVEIEQEDEPAPAAPEEDEPAPAAPEEPDPATTVPPAPAREIVIVPSNEVAFVPSLPARVGSVAAQVGQPPPDEPALRLFTGALWIGGDVEASERDLLVEGMEASVFAESTGEQVDGVLAAVGETVTNPESQVPSRPITVTPSTPVDSTWIGMELRIVVLVETAPDGALVVPLSALRARSSDGGQEVVVVQEGDERRAVRVSAGLSAEGLVVVTPEQAGQLAVGDQVLVGR